MSKNLSSFEHVAIIMDGNGRWASGRNRPRIWGHIRGTKTILKITEEALAQNLKSLTLYAFSSENWSRPKIEILTIFSLLKKFIKAEKEKMIRENIRFRVMGERESIPVDAKELILDLEQATENNTGLKLTIAFSYGGRNEILDACNKCLNDGLKVVTESDLVSKLYYPDLENIDLLIRTGGDYRISNFLLWQIAYAELCFVETKWPDFTKEEFRELLKSAQTRERRFGGVSGSLDLSNIKKMANEQIKDLKKDR